MRIQPFHTILAASDLERASDPVLTVAAALAARTGAAFHVVHTVVAPSALQVERNPALLERQVEKAQNALAAQVRYCLPDGPVPAFRAVVSSAASEGILAHASAVGADLIVTGPHGKNHLSTLFLGTTADRVLRTAHVPCLIVRAQLALPLARLGVPTDFSEPAREALALALRWAAALGEHAAVNVLHAGWAVYREDDPDFEQEIVRPQLERQLDAAQRNTGASAGLTLRTEVRWNNEPVAPILRWAEDRNLDLLVMGTHGSSGLKRALIGSVASAVARSAPCPVLLVPPPRRAPASAVS